MVSFQGWNDAGDAASQAVSLVRESQEVETSFRLDEEEFFDYQFIRPVIKIGITGQKTINWPAVEFSFTAPNLDNDLEYAFVEGVEPSRGWRTFASEFVQILLEHEATGVVFVGALLADTPHTRPTPIHVSTDNPEIQQESDLKSSKYEGPVGIISVLTEQAEALGIPSINVWASVPHYAHGSPCPLATKGLVEKLSEVLEFAVDTEELEQQSKIWADNVTEQIQEDSELRGYVEQLEKMFDTEESYEASGDAIAEEFEKYLRTKNDDDDAPEGGLPGGGHHPSQ